MNFDPSCCCRLAGGRLNPSPPPAFVPWLEAAKLITSSTLVRVSGQKRSAQRIDMPPWEWPMIAIRLPDRSCMVRMERTRYSAAIWMSPSVRNGISIAHHGIPRAVRARS